MRPYIGFGGADGSRMARWSLQLVLDEAVEFQARQFRAARPDLRRQNFINGRLVVIRLRFREQNAVHDIADTDFGDLVRIGEIQKQGMLLLQIGDLLCWALRLTCCAGSKGINLDQFRKDRLAVDIRLWRVEEAEFI